MLKGVPLSYDDTTITGWTYPWKSQLHYAPAPSEPNGRRYLYTSMIIESSPGRKLHYMRASVEDPDFRKLKVRALVLQVMGLDEAVLAAGGATRKPKTELPADGEVGGMPLEIDMTLACPKHEKGSLRLKEVDEFDKPDTITFTKKPNLLCYKDPADRDASRAYFANEVAVMDMLHDKPHGNHGWHRLK